MKERLGACSLELALTAAEELGVAALLDRARNIVLAGEALAEDGGEVSEEAFFAALEEEAQASAGFFQIEER